LHFENARRVKFVFQFKNQLITKFILINNKNTLQEKFTHNKKCALKVLNYFRDEKYKVLSLRTLRSLREIPTDLTHYRANIVV